MDAPYLRRACTALAVAEVRAGEVEEGRAVLARCERVFPIPTRVAWFKAQVAALASAPD